MKQFFNEHSQNTRARMSYKDAEILNNYARKLSPEVTVELDQVRFSHSSKEGTKAVIDFDWSWNIDPFVTRTDVVVLSWGKPLSSDRYESFGKVTYKHVLTGKKTKKTINIDKKVANKGCSFKFPMNYKGVEAKVAMSGYVRVYLEEPDENYSTFEVVGAYGHTTLRATPSFTIPAAGTINFSWGMDDTQTDRVIKD